MSSCFVLPSTHWGRRRLCPTATSLHVCGASPGCTVASARLSSGSASEGRVAVGAGAAVAVAVVSAAVVAAVAAAAVGAVVAAAAVDAGASFAPRRATSWTIRLWYSMASETLAGPYIAPIVAWTEVSSVPLSSAAATLAWSTCSGISR